MNKAQRRLRKRESQLDRSTPLGTEFQLLSWSLTGNEIG